MQNQSGWLRSRRVQWLRVGYGGQANAEPAYAYFANPGPLAKEKARSDATGGLQSGFFQQYPKPL